MSTGPPTQPPPPPAPLPEPGREPEPPSAGDRLPAKDGYVGIPRSAVRGIDVLVGLVIAVAVIVFGVILVAAFDPSLTSETEDASDAGTLLTQLFTVLGMVGAAVGYSAYVNKERIAASLRLLGVRGTRPGLLVSSALIGIGLYFLSAIVLGLLLSPEQDDIAENLGADRDGAVLVTVLAGILIIAGASLGEEIMFRGFVFGGLRQSMGLWPAAIGSGLLFGVLHLTAGDLAVALQLTVFGVILAWVYERSGSLWTPIALHAVNNSIAFTLLVTDTI